MHTLWGVLHTHRGQRKVSGVLLYHPLPRFLEAGSYRAQSSPFLLGLLTSKLTRSTCLPCPYATGTYGYAWLLCGYQAFKLRSSCLHCQSSYPLGHLPSCLLAGFSAIVFISRVPCILQNQDARIPKGDTMENTET